jgi:glucose/arabinose dehydrogenase
MRTNPRIRRFPVQALAAQVLTGSVLALLAANAGADFTYPNFSSTAGLALVGSAVQAGNRLRLTPASSSQAGAAWYQTKQLVAPGFDTTFDFQLSTAVGADGFAFLVQNSSAAPLGGTGCALAYHGLSNSLAVEFDTYANSTCQGTTVSDPNGIHISVHTLGWLPNSVSEAASLGATLAIPDFADGQPHVGRVRYEGGILAVYIDDLAVPALSVALDLAQFLTLDQGAAWVGFTASTGGLAEAHELLSWTFDETTQSGGNLPPAAPQITEPSTNGQVVSPADVHMETGPFSDPNAGDQHLCTDWEIWRMSPSEQVWISAGATGVERLHTHLGDGVFVNSHTGQSELFPGTDYTLRVRHSDDSGALATQWSPWSQRTFHTGATIQIFPLKLQDAVDVPAPRWVVASSGANVILPPAGTPPRLRLESGVGALVLEIRANDGVTNTVTNPPELADHAAMRVQIQGGSLGLTLPASDLFVVDDHCQTHQLLLPAASIAPGAANYYWISAAGASYVGNSGQTLPSFGTLARGLSPPWDPRQEGFRVEVFAAGFTLPVNIVFVPSAGPLPGDPFCYVSELYGAIKVVARDGTVASYASGLLNFNPTGAFPGSGEQGLTGLAVDPASGDVFASMLYASSINPSLHFPKLVRFHSLDGGHTAASQTTILDMVNETQGQSHQVSNLTIAPDGKLLCHMGDGFTTSTAQDLNSFRGKILRLKLDGSPAPDNPFYDASNGITARDYVFAYGVRNPFGGDWRFADGSQYVVENGPSVDRFAKVVAGRNYLWDGSDGSMANFALYNWNPSHGPVNLAFVQPETFGGSGFPPSSMGHAFVSESGPTYATGPQTLGKRITEWILDPNGVLVAGPIPFLEYAGVGKATACGLEAGPDGLYLSELYYDAGTNATQAGARILRISYDPASDCNGNGGDDACDIASGASQDVNANGIPDECECAGASYCTAKVNSLGCTPTIGSLGSASAGLPDDFVITAANVLNNKPGIVIWSTSAAASPFGGGTLCLQTPIHRLPATSSGGSPSGNDCSGAYSQPITDAYMASHNLGAGAAAHFQVWSRDPGFAAPDNVGLTNALRVLVCP